MDKREVLIKAVVDAWNNPGPRPDVHALVKRHFRRMWPSLARAVEMLANYERTVTQPNRKNTNKES